MKNVYKFPKYCKKCGVKLKFVKAAYSGRFDHKTGEPEVYKLHLSPNGPKEREINKFWSPISWTPGTKSGYHEYNYGVSYHVNDGYVDCPLHTHRKRDDYSWPF